MEMISEKLYHFFWHLIGPDIHPLQLLFNAGTMLKKHFVNCETRTSTCRSFATISSGLYRILAIAVLLDVKDIPQVGPLQWGRITRCGAVAALIGYKFHLVN